MKNAKTFASAFVACSVVAVIVVIITIYSNKDDTNAVSSTNATSSTNSTSSTKNEQTEKRARPNIIVMQPDDFPFFTEWSPPPKNPKERNRREPFAEVFPNRYEMPYLEQLRTQGLQMMQAYAASAMCAPSRFSTITGRYASRSGYGRSMNVNETTQSFVNVPNSRLQDMEGQARDCTEDNVAAVLKKHGYRTGVVGKWHLTPETRGAPPSLYNATTAQIRSCGFDFADGIYIANLNNARDGVRKYSHNQEWVTSKAIEFISSEDDSDKPFFLYFNPTVPHPSGNVAEALRNFTCQHTPDGMLETEPKIPKMTADYQNCEEYRKSVFQRAGESTSSHDLGAIWVDDSIGALIETLRTSNKLNNTIFLFQLDHGVEAKATSWENGNRIAQFIHYPDEFGTEGRKMYAPVSTIDVTPTLFDFAGVNKNELYKMDGQSWRNFPKYEKGKTFSQGDGDKNRCIMSELNYDRSLVCGRCHKLLSTTNSESGSGAGPGMGQSIDRGFATGNNEMYFSLCDEDGNYINYPKKSPEINNTAWDNWSDFMAMQKVMKCTLEKTFPKKQPDFDIPTDCSFSDALDEFIGITAPPAKAPTTSPTITGGTITGGIDCRDITTSWIATVGPLAGNEVNCTWVAVGGAGSGRCRANGPNVDKCPFSCGLCG